MKAPIGIIDSGAGGLTVVKEMQRMLPNESIIYIGDAARCPYGPRPADEIRTFTIEMATALSAMGIKMLVIACNTATAVALDEVRELFHFPVIGVITPGARAAINATTTGEIVVLGTEGTIKSGAYDNNIHAFSPTAKVYPLACPEFVPIVESGQYNSEKANAIVKRTLRNLNNIDFDVAILGCTHYPLLEHHIRVHLPNNIKIISSANETILDVKRSLMQKGIQNLAKPSLDPIFYTTGLPENFRTIVASWLSLEQPDVRHIEL